MSNEIVCIFFHPSWSERLILEMVKCGTNSYCESLFKFRLTYCQFLNVGTFNDFRNRIVLESCCHRLCITVVNSISFGVYEKDHETFRLKNKAFT